MTVLMNVATCWCCVDWCWQCWRDWENILVYCESFDDTCCLCWLCWRYRQKETSSETRNELELTMFMDIALCWCCVDWCWQCWRNCKNVPCYCESFDDTCCLCWLCWRYRQRETSSETRNELELTMLMDVAVCWCCVDWCWQCWRNCKNVPCYCSSFDDTCCLCWLCWCYRQRETRNELEMTMLMDVAVCCCYDDWCWQMLMKGFVGEYMLIFLWLISTHLEPKNTTRAHFLDVNTELNHTTLSRE